jgi:hypothetical protein
VDSALKPKSSSVFIPSLSAWKEGLALGELGIAGSCEWIGDFWVRICLIGERSGDLPCFCMYVKKKSTLFAIGKCGLCKKKGN